MSIKFKQWFFQDMPESATRDEWQDWENQARKNKVRWFLADTFPFWCWKTFVKPIEKAKSWLRYRTFDQYHTIKTTLKPGYYDIKVKGAKQNFSQIFFFVYLRVTSWLFFWIFSK